MLTDPSEYDMDMVLIPDGDYEACIKQVYVNINLRKCNCTGRSALNLNHAKWVLKRIQGPTTTTRRNKLTFPYHSQASQDKFRSLYRISDVVPFDDAVINLVTVAQTALFLFHLLKKEYIDGLLCNETMKAFGNFYREYHPAEIQEVIESLWSLYLVFFFSSCVVKLDPRSLDGTALAHSINYQAHNVSAKAIQSRVYSKNHLKW